MSIRLGLMSDLGVSWVRVNMVTPPANVPSMTSVDDAASYSRAGKKLFITTTDANLKRVSAGSDDFAMFGDALRKQVAQYQPAILAVENEIDNADYQATPEMYLHELQIACAAAHEVHAKCTDGGFTAKMAIALIAYNFKQKGDQANADRYGKYLRLWYSLKLQPNPTGNSLDEFLAKVGAPRAYGILQKIRASGADYADLHWYVRPSGAVSDGDQDDLLRQGVKVLTTVSGLPVLAGEVGVDLPHGNDRAVDGGPYLRMLTEMKALNVSPVIAWNPGSGLFKANAGALSLVDAGGGLLPLGTAYKQASHVQGGSSQKGGC